MTLSEAELKTVGIANDLRKTETLFSATSGNLLLRNSFLNRMRTQTILIYTADYIKGILIEAIGALIK